MISAIIYGLCAFTSFICGWLLLQAYLRSRYGLLLWGGLCFIGLTLNNVLLVIDKLWVPYDYFTTARLYAALLGMSVLLYGLVWEKE